MLTHIFGSMEAFFGDMYRPVLKVSGIIGIIILSTILVKVGGHLIKKIFEKQKSLKYGIDSKRVDTVSTLLVSVFRYAVYLVAIVTILTDIFDLKSVLAAAGIGGIAIGLGAQSLIKDVLSGFFIIMEDQYIVGDVITVENMTGTVEELEFRVTKIRNANGDLHTIPNGEVKKVTNHSRGNKAVNVDIPLAYSSDVNKAITAANDVCTMVTGEFSKIVDCPKVLGITDLGKEGMTLRITAKTLPNEHLELERRIRFLIKESFEKYNIEFVEKK